MNATKAGCSPASGLCGVLRCPCGKNRFCPKETVGRPGRVLVLLGSLRGKAPSLQNIPAHRKSSELPPSRALVRMIFAYVGHTFYLPVFATGKLWQPTIGDDRTHQIVSSAQRGTDDVRTEWEQLLDMGHRRRAVLSAVRQDWRCRTMKL